MQILIFIAVVTLHFTVFLRLHLKSIKIYKASAAIAAGYQKELLTITKIGT